jgi:hypothetical protein
MSSFRCSKIWSLGHKLGPTELVTLIATGLKPGVAAFIIDKTALPACMRICLGGGLELSRRRNASPADGQIWPSSPPSQDMAGVPLVYMISITLAMIPECFLLWGKLVYRRVYVLYGTMISELHTEI